MYDIQKKVNAVMSYYRQIRRRQEYEWVKFTDYRHRFHMTKANEFFIGVMFDQLGNADRAWEGAKHFVATHFNQTDNFWNEIRDSRHAKLNRICQKGFYGKTYAVRYASSKFPTWLRTNARIMTDKYNSDPRNIWKNAGVDEIRNRLERFSGISVALSRMATNLLVRNYGVAGGQQVRSQLFLKPDILLKRVMYRVGFIENENERAVLEAERIMKQDRILRSPADFDAAIWVIGREYCYPDNPDCENCPINHVCDRVNL